MPASYDIAVIGAGLAGLTYANVAAAKGYRVAVVEQHFKPGGYATNFTRLRRSVLFDCSLHKITGLGPNGNVRDALVRAGLWDRLEFFMYEDLTSVIVDGRRYDLSADYETARRQLATYFPADVAGLELFFADVATHGLQNYMFARMALGEYRLDVELLERSRVLSRLTALEYFRQLFRSDDLIVIFSAMAINLGVIAREIDALYFLHFAYAFFSTGPGYVHGTSQTISDTMAAELERRGGKVYLGEEVRSIETREGHVAALLTTRLRLEVDEVVATCSPHAVAEMVDVNSLGPKFRQQLDQLEVGMSSFSVYAVTDEAPSQLGLTRSEFIIACSTAEAEAAEGEARYDRWALSVTNYHLLDASVGNVVKMTILDVPARWFELSKADYKREKERVQTILVERIRRVFPRLVEHFVYLESSTPRTNHRYTKAPKGSAFAYKARPGRNLRFLRGCRLGGLRFVGTWVVGAGYESAICLGFTEAQLRPSKSAPAKEQTA